MISQFIESVCKPMQRLCSKVYEIAISKGNWNNLIEGATLRLVS